ncbi:hypothetical protein [Maricaulis sp.]|uniref:hypothetical protein n=1 Tax=Maricaulis sp. TaxID=1486257 RepID=UPI003A94CFF0
MAVLTDYVWASAFTLPLFGIVWFVVERMGAEMIARFGLPVRLIGASVLWAVLTSIASLPPLFAVGQAFTWGFGPLLSGAPTTPVAASLFLIPGAAWGIVFWIRAPKPTTAGIAA